MMFAIDPHLPEECITIYGGSAIIMLAVEETDVRLLLGLCFICNTPSAYAVSSVLHPPVESAHALPSFGHSR
jgi:hypothetical protein